MCLDTAIHGRATRNSPVAVIKDCFWLGRRGARPHITHNDRNAIGTVQTNRKRKKQGSPCRGLSVPATVYWLRGARTEPISWPRTATITPIWQTLSHMDRWPPKSTNESSPLPASKNNRERNHPSADNLDPDSPTRPCVTSRPPRTRRHVQYRSVCLGDVAFGVG